jgi:hypothetical protein
MPVNLNPNIVESPILNVLDRSLSAPYHSHLYNLSSSIAVLLLLGWVLRLLM